jgi:hypothetical protein
MHINGNNHGTFDPERSEAGEKAEDERETSAELGKSGERLKETGYRRFTPHPMKGILNLSPSVKYEGISYDDPHSKKDQIHVDSVISDRKKFCFHYEPPFSPGFVKTFAIEDTLKLGLPVEKNPQINRLKIAAKRRIPCTRAERFVIAGTREAQERYYL